MVKSPGNRMQKETRRSTMLLPVRRCVRRKCLLTHEFARKVASRHAGEFFRKFQTRVYDSTEEEKESEEINRQIYSRFLRTLHSAVRDKDGLMEAWGALQRDRGNFSGVFYGDDKLRTAKFYALLIPLCLHAVWPSTSVTPTVPPLTGKCYLLSIVSVKPLIKLH